jgi:phosphonate C-P lyase system protein PhnG
MDIDYILCECNLDPLQQFIEKLEVNYDVTIVKEPSICLTMVKAEDSVEFQEFYLGEALTTECEIIVNGKLGYGVCLGDEPVRSYCMAFIDAVTQLGDYSDAVIRNFLNDQLAIIEYENKLEYNHILRSKVDFKLMEQD